MERMEFEERAISQWYYATGLAWLSLVIFGCVVIAAYREFLAAAIGTAALGGLGLFVLYRQACRTAQRVVVSDAGIDGQGLCRRSINHLGWHEINEIQRFTKRTMQGPIVFIRLRSGDRKIEIVFHEKLPGFANLCDVIRVRAASANETTPTFFERLQWL